MRCGSNSACCAQSGSLTEHLLQHMRTSSWCPVCQYSRAVTRGPWSGSSLLSGVAQSVSGACQTSRPAQVGTGSIVARASGTRRRNLRRRCRICKGRRDACTSAAEHRYASGARYPPIHRPLNITRKHDQVESSDHFHPPPS